MHIYQEFMSFISIIFFKYLGMLPLKVLQKIGACIGNLVWIFPTKYKNNLICNIKQAFPQHPPKLPRSAMRQIFKMYFELPFFWSKSNKKFLHEINLKFDWSPIEESLLAKKGVIIVSAHVGAYELIAPLVAFAHTFTFLYKPARSRWLNSLASTYRVSENLKMVPANRNGVRELSRDLRNGGMVGVGVDHTPAKGSGVYAPFFKRPAYTMTLVQRLQKLADCPIYAVGIERTEDSEIYKLHIIPVEKPSNGDPVEFATTLNQTVEQLICLMPSQYLWGYNRYKPPTKDLN